MKDPFADLRDRVRRFFTEDPTGALVLSLFKPEPPFARGSLISAMIATSSMIAVASLAGVTLVALAVLLVALFLMSLILTRVMGIDLGLPSDLAGFAYGPRGY